MVETAFTKLVGCKVPIQLAPVGGVDLVAAVSSAGGLGMIGAPMASPDELIAMIAEVRNKTDGVFGINFLMPFLDPAVIEAVAPHVRVVEFFYNDPDTKLVDAAHAGGAIAAWQAGSVEEAKAAADAGCDFVVIQGTEAGGHVRGTATLGSMLERTVAAVAVPVVAAGGIATRRDVADALGAGAAAVRIGTLFLASSESDAHPAYVDALIGASGDDTVLTETFSFMWPEAPHRVLRSSVERAEAVEGEVVGEMAMGDARVPVPRFAPMPPRLTTTGDIGAMALYAGEGVGAVERVRPAADIVADLVEGL
jgi:nitronate monooxygenase